MEYICPICKTGRYVKEDRHRVEIFCSNCGLVLASAPPYFCDTIGTKYYYPYGFLLK